MEVETSLPLAEAALPLAEAALLVEFLGRPAASRENKEMEAVTNLANPSFKLWLMRCSDRCQTLEIKAMSTPQHVRTHGQASPDQSANVMQVKHRPTVRHCPTAIKPTSLSIEHPWVRHCPTPVHIESGIARPVQTRATHFQPQLAMITS